eukprot:Skav212700  [mRNA]  locus=scaffold1930:342059:342788:+ [translate_table: standard]
MHPASQSPSWNTSRQLSSPSKWKRKPNLRLSQVPAWSRLMSIRGAVLVA